MTWRSKKGAPPLLAIALATALIGCAQRTNTGSYRTVPAPATRTTMADATPLRTLPPPSVPPQGMSHEGLPPDPPLTDRGHIDESRLSELDESPVALRHRELVMQGSTIVAPPGVTFHRVHHDPAVWEVRDTSGRRAALLMEVPWSHVIAAAPRMLFTHAGDDADIEVAEWNGTTTPILREYFWTPIYFYLLERRAGDTGWILASWEPETDAPGTTL